MIRTAPRAVLLALALALAAAGASAAERAAIDPKYKWNLAELYPSDDAWRVGRDDVQRRIAQVTAQRGKLGESADALWRGLDAYFGADRELSRVAVYASSRSDEDTRVSATREMKQAAQQLRVELDTAGSYIRPELLTLDPAKLKAWLASDPRLAEYRFFVEDALRARPHTRSAGEEQVAAQAGDLYAVPNEIYGILKDAELPWREVKLSSGETKRIDTSAFSLVRASPVREDRNLAFDAYFGALRGFEATIGAALFGTVRAHVADAKIHHFGSSLEAALFPNDIPTKLYMQLVADVRRNLPTLHRYLALRKRLLGVDRLRYQDLYAPLVGSVDLRFTPDEARAITLAAVAPLGKEYQAALEKGYRSGWTDFLPSTGKRPGAYSTGVYGVHPYQLLNYNGLYEDLSTLAHESGHSIHTYLSFASQPYATSSYATFVAEVASTLNENLLVHYMLGRTKDDATRLALLGNYLERLRQTLFRQTQFAEFELAIHEQAEKGQPLTGEGLTQLYLKITRAYYGHDRGVCEVPDLVGIEWAFIPHFHYDFYVYQYATSEVASTALAKAIRDDEKRGKTRARDAYLGLLRAGGSNYPVELLRAAGVDMTTSAPFEAAMAEMNGIIDEMDGILARQEKAKAGKRK